MSINFSSLATAENKRVIPFLYQFEFYTHNHLLIFPVTTSSLPHLFLLMTSLWAAKRCNSEGARSELCGVWGITVHPSFVIVSCVFKLVCRCGLSCWKRISAPFWWDRTLLKCFCELLKVWMYRFELLVCPRDIMPTEVTPCASQKTVVMTFPAEGISVNFFFWEVGCCHSIVFFLCVVQNDGPCFIPSDNLLQKAFTISHAMGEHIWTLCTVV